MYFKVCPWRKTLYGQIILIPFLVPKACLSVTFLKQRKSGCVTKVGSVLATGTSESIIKMINSQLSKVK